MFEISFSVLNKHRFYPIQVPVFWAIKGGFACASDIETLNPGFVAVSLATNQCRPRHIATSISVTSE